MVNERVSPLGNKTELTLVLTFHRSRNGDEVMAEAVGTFDAPLATLKH